MNTGPVGQRYRRRAAIIGALVLATALGAALVVVHWGNPQESAAALEPLQTSRLPSVPVAAGATAAAEYSPLFPELTALDFSGLSAAYPALSAPPGPMGIAGPAPQLSFGSEWAAPVLARLRDMHVESQPPPRPIPAQSLTQILGFPF